ncbi:hypothetical protein NFX46_20915 [Streptomyces phaeoluteigriseus]|uniref:Condensation domain-containing protein n=1 Tax=Streptomyces phaeoluteigriseus TaxID=114686 RepID=A0ABY4ZA98_9ACTN|nr:hypothetical protein [Streptomyces phaeoluteigriseus]USQ85964.1 hypothetical protein NFX46_20915 [Streptomyces phaeoluteigriseus]
MWFTTEAGIRYTLTFKEADPTDADLLPEPVLTEAIAAAILNHPGFVTADADSPRELVPCRTPPPVPSPRSPTRPGCAALSPGATARARTSSASTPPHRAARPGLGGRHPTHRAHPDRLHRPAATRRAGRADAVTGLQTVTVRLFPGTHTYPTHQAGALAERLVKDLHCALRYTTGRP